MQKYKAISKNIDYLQIDNPRTDKEKLVWINIKNAGKNEMEYLRKKYRFDLKHLQASSAKLISQRPIVRNEDGYLFMILHFPILKNGIIQASEIDFFVGHGFLVTLHTNDNEALTNFFNLAKKDGNSLLAYEFESSAILLYEILEKLMANCYEHLDKNSIKINQVEDTIFDHQQKQAVTEILLLRRNIINYRKIMQNHKNIVKKLMVMESGIVPPANIKKYYIVLLERSKKIWEILENQKEMVEALHDTNESLLNYQISSTMKTLTIFSVIVFPLTLLAAIFGMNTVNGMPFINNENGFWLIIAIMLMGSLGMFSFFEKKKWI
jgi:magnesium transporter